MPTRQRQVAEVMIDCFPDKPSNQEICENYIKSNSNYAKLAVFEQISDNGSFCGIKMVSEESDNG